ncbi:MAG: protein-(glutamine-N5) methyltransferase, release factor-specific [Acidimicrobiales bacterium]|nr:protein-(glutamine-N5) methyltransferase, release factor-specific [Acidimicrobiales bacterium]
MDPGSAASWRRLQDAAVAQLAPIFGNDAGGREVRWMIEEASGYEGADLLVLLDQPAPERGAVALAGMVRRRVAGEPIQYVLGHWPFRILDLLVDRRVLIPRPETEQVVERALAELDAVTRPGRRGTVVDLGSGSGAIGLSVAAERPGTTVWCVDASADALAVTRANLAGLGMAGGRVRVAEGSWFEPLPPELRGAVDLVVTNPPYVAADELLPPEVQDWEPAAALVAGPTGLEAIEQIVAEVGAWLAPGGALVVEIGATQGPAASEIAAVAGFVDIALHPDLAGHDRALVARTPA